QVPAHGVRGRRAADKGPCAIGDLAHMALLHCGESLELRGHRCIALSRHTRRQAPIARGGPSLQRLGDGQEFLDGADPYVDWPDGAHRSSLRCWRVFFVVQLTHVKAATQRNMNVKATSNLIRHLFCADYISKALADWVEASRFN